MARLQNLAARRPTSWSCRGHEVPTEPDCWTQPPASSFLFQAIAVIIYCCPIDYRPHHRSSPCMVVPLSKKRISPKRPKNGSLPLLTILFGLLSILGCGPDSEDQVAPPPARPLRMMESAIRRGQLSEAWKYVNDVVEEHGEKQDVLAKIARLAHETNRPDEAAKYLVLACRAESFNDEKRVQQAMIALVGIGKLYEGLELLQDAVAHHPEQHESRRWLFDLLMGSEDRQAGLPHGRYLIRARKFDVELLKALSNTEYRTMDAQPLLQMTERNPDDTRPLLGDARQKFDERDYSEAIKVLRSITSKFPDFAPAQSLLGRSLAGSGDWQAFEQWAEKVPTSVSDYPDYWLALGDWARQKERDSEAARCYWEATQVDPDVMEAWTKLGMTLRRAQANSTENSTKNSSIAMANQSLLEAVPNQLLDLIDQRASHLSTFNLQKQKFERTGGVSRETAIEMSETLLTIGRYWEAEAWSSVALGLPEDDSVPAEEVRQKIIKQLAQDTPWQMTKDSPELLINLTAIAPPSINRITPKRGGTVAHSKTMEASEVGFLLKNEASRRGLTFFGRTSDRLDQPGIMLFQTLGCGGGTLDYDLDGWSDLYFGAAEGTPPAKDSSPNAIFRNLSGIFRDHTKAAAVGDRGFTQGIAVGDINEDGFPDLLVLNYGPNSLFINNGDGSFSDQTTRFSSNDSTWSTSGAIADLDGDGLSDLVVLNYCDGLEPAHVTCPMPDSNISRSCSPVKFPAALDQFYQTQPDGDLIDQTEKWDGQPSVIGRGLGIVIGALDNRSGNDILIANDMTNNHHWSLQTQGDPQSTENEINGERPQLVESAMLRGLGTDDRSLAQGSMGIATADLNRDGDLDFYITNFDKEYNTLHDQRSSGIWQDVTPAVDLVTPTMPLVGFGTEAVDLDSDGQLELIVANGHVDMFSRGNEKSLYDHPMQIFQRQVNSKYQSIGDQMVGDYFDRSHVARALWTIDANGDQLTDLVVTHQTEPVALLVNHSPQVGNSIRLELIGTTSSRFAVGAKVHVHAKDQSWSAWQISGDGYLCSNERTLHIGLGQAIELCKVEIQWPSGLSQSFRDLSSGMTHLLIEGESQAFTQTPLMGNLE